MCSEKENRNESDTQQLINGDPGSVPLAKLLPVVKIVGEIMGQMDIFMEALLDVVDEGLEMKEEDILMMTARPGFAPVIVTVAEVEKIMPEFNEEDGVLEIPDLCLMVSFHPDDLTCIDGKTYLTGPMVFFDMDEDCRFISLKAEDMYLITGYMTSNSVTLKNGETEFQALCLG